MQTQLIKIVLIVLCLVGFIAADGYAVHDDGTPHAKQSDYLGSEECGKCHRKAFKVWRESKLARAIEALGPRKSMKAKKKMGLDPYTDYSQKKECIKCHTTGFESNGEGYTFSEYGIGCEACHGPGRKYVRLMKTKGKKYKRENLEKAGLVTDFTDICKNCHNEHSPFIGPDYIFNVKERYRGIHGIIQLKYHESIKRFLDDEDKKYETQEKSK